MSLEGQIHVPERVGLVVVGRNEGARLRRSLERTADRVPVVYVDSGSTDGSPETARRMGYYVVDLDPSEPFTAARARNAGFAALQARWPDRVDYVHFQDGDCLVDQRWLLAGRAELRRDPRVGLVAGVLREQDAESSAFSRLLDMEWHQPCGDVVKIGGNAMVRCDAFEEVEGFRGDLPAGEEADLHLRLRKAGWIVRRIDAPMAYHDAGMTRFSQWFRRHVRAGQALAEGVHIHDRGVRQELRAQRSNYFWGLAVPAMGLVGAPLTFGAASVVPAAGYAALYAKVIRNELRAGRSLEDAELYARFAVLAKLPQALGQLRYEWLRAQGRRTEVIDWREGGRPRREGGLTSASADSIGASGQER